jgi:YbbR domain-containing protein
MNDSMMMLVIAAVVLFAVMNNRKNPADTPQPASETLVSRAPTTVFEEMQRLAQSGDSGEWTMND